MTNIHSKLKTRRQRRLDAKEAGQLFQPQYSSGVRFDKGRKLTVGGAPKSYEEAYGVGYERFNNKFVTIRSTTEVAE